MTIAKEYRYHAPSQQLKHRDYAYSLKLHACFHKGKAYRCFSYKEGSHGKVQCDYEIIGVGRDSLGGLRYRFNRCIYVRMTALT